MTSTASTKRGHRSRAGTRGEHGAALAASHPRSVPIVEPEDEYSQQADQPFVEGAYDAIDPDLRHRMISEAAYRRFAERGYEDGYDFDDWRAAEADIEHLLLNPKD